MFQTQRVEIEWAGRKLTLETGRMARQADAVVHAVTRPRTHRVLELTILPMTDDSMN